MDTFTLTPRQGPKPETTKPTREQPFPHKQISQNAPATMQEALFERAANLRGVTIGKSLVSVPGARAFHLSESLANGPAAAFQKGREFAHLHPPEDGSLHMTLPPDAYRAVLDAGWGEPHPVSTTMMVWGPRDADELETVWKILCASYAYATGKYAA